MSSSDALHVAVERLVQELATRATEAVRAECARQVAALQGQLHDTQARVRALEDGWPIVGSPAVATLRRAVRDRVAVWFATRLQDLQPRGTAGRPPTRDAVVRALAARNAAQALCYRMLYDRFGIPELKALATSQVPDALAWVTQAEAPVAAIFRATLRTAIAQRVAFWARRGAIPDTPAARQGCRQLLWLAVRQSGLDPLDGEIARRRLLRLVLRAPVPARYATRRPAAR